ncbi:HNH endonuclease signature motif containing protein [Microbacterium cremeum]|uniref:HNH endonuclease signature motif containing protein n=1 Tax=Microbacterium cremeum TaxID=2782169 RepID=UPI0018885F2F|nr:HNH endonuclease signature motif containing protein [Microbacterium cremeum]
MAFFSDLGEHVAVLRGLLGADIAADALPGIMAALDDDAIVEIISGASNLIRAAEKVRIVASGVAAARSTREHGHGGLAQKRGHNSLAALIQDLTGATRADAVKHVRLGESLLAGMGAALDDGAGESTDAAPAGSLDAEVAAEPWHAPLGRALLAGTISSAQHDVILRGLGEPPTVDDPDASRHIADVWSLAAEQLAAEAGERTVEELAKAARTVRDRLDPEGAGRRFDERFERRSFRLGTDSDGIRRASIAFDDVGGAWMDAILDSALRPRRGGPRFIDPAEKERAEQLVADPRTNEQLAYDLVLDVLRAGALAEEKTVFGTRQAGIRVLITADDREAHADGRPAIGLLEESQTSVPASLAAQHACDTGGVECTIDRDGNPLRLGREHRLYTAKQRLTLALRDGGCRWRGCDRPPSYCEAHHIDHFVADHGRTDVDRGILLCRYHHMQLHHGGWRITRDGLGDFVLHPPPGRGDPLTLAPRLTLRYAWAGIDPPPRRFLPAA